MAYRIPRGYGRNRPQYQELSEGVRPEATAVPMEAWTGLAPVRVDELHHDPIVLDPGTIVGIATGGDADGKLFPAHGLTGSNQIWMKHHSDGATWGLEAVTHEYNVTQITAGPVYPLGVIFQPIYSFALQATYTNYKRNENVGFVTDYLIQIPAINEEERNIQAGDKVCVGLNLPPNPETGTSVGEYGQSVTAGKEMGRFSAYNGTLAEVRYIIGTCLKRTTFATGTASTKLSDESAISNITLSTTGIAEFKGLDKVQTVPGLGLAGSGTAGVPAWLTGAVSGADTNYHMLTILVRL